MYKELLDPLSDYGAVTLIVAAAGAVAGLVRAYIAYRTRLHEEREASARAASRVIGLVGLAKTRHDIVRIVERDRDGHREVELGRRNPLAANDREEAA